MRLPFTRFVDIANTVALAERREEKQRLEEGAFIGYQVYLCAPKGNEQPMPFAKWRDMLLTEPDEERAQVDSLSDEERQRLADETVEKAEQIVLRYQSSQQGG